MTREELQAAAKAHDIKGNLKSEVIRKQLKEKSANSKPSVPSSLLSIVYESIWMIKVKEFNIVFTHHIPSILTWYYHYRKDPSVWGGLPAILMIELSTLPELFMAPLEYLQHPLVRKSKYWGYLYKPIFTTLIRVPMTYCVDIPLFARLFGSSDLLKKRGFQRAFDKIEKKSEKKI